MTLTHPAGCGGGIRQIVNVIVDAPIEMTGKLSKGTLRDKAVKIRGIHWDAATLYCPKCGWMLRLAKGE